MMYGRKVETGKQRWESYHTMNELSKKSRKQPLAGLTCAFSDKVLDAVEGLQFESLDDKKDVKEIMELLEKQDVEGMKKTYESYQFFLLD